MNQKNKQNSDKKKNKKHLFQKVKTVDKIFFTQNLAVLIKAGFSLSHALQTVSRQTKQKWFTQIIKKVSKNVEEGQSFANALRKYEKIFGALYINMIESGEVSGRLEQTLRELVIQLKRSHTLLLKVRNALAYPVIILLAMSVIGTGMVIFVLPKIVSVYKDATYALPLPTRIIMAFSDFVTKHGLVTIAIILILVIVIFLLQKQEKVKLPLHWLILRLPIFGVIVQEYNIARFSRVFHSLISTDIPIITSFQIITRTMQNRQYIQALQKAVPKLEQGIPIGQVLAEDNVLFPPTVIEMIIVAEKSGALEEMTEEIAIHYEEEVSSALDGLSVLIEPVLMLFLGAAVALIAVAVLLPMYSLVNVI
ncbi:MAG: hypothetical protein A2233_02465 [Candidatus Kerfeldbacteria bacterium RIFOXYA2_FULL_38_24]|uniref:Type II secretion system protein GspF domain-containing protein n=1 Tax=Candidatus Kerfeldbacteria bacterium RIFOXYB2_FULL_38_14 TaxID=1798547 RepID=A0A1G2B9K4_9BACT|nr:MAG: hypothetical protein A2233_02465 [Candidatus Kerfeldbacteria bacterium RIFOXYA2_FULL_38_24]OGY85841.1 MAG: hypothetical protein A2319_05805 [Candidatus Kerfeldbacteria bacterium RIFOXYB2_FULL_38_14]OGY89120.1 MAG: hypothetical protein A2458_02580 [Candidatus Kerfeldbacteria bacterium RIFOXYC2_FULL_38_9]